MNLRKNKIWTIFFLIAFALFASCHKETTQEIQRKLELQLLEEYISDNNIQEAPKKSGLYYIELEEGIGDSIKPGDIVQVLYKYYLIDSTLIYDSGNFNPTQYTVGLGKPNAGVDEAFTYMKKGGRAKLIVPSEVGFGQTGNIGIPGFSTLLYEIYIYKLIQAQ